MIAEFTANEEQIFKQTVEWLSTKLDYTPILVKQQTPAFYINPFTRTFQNENDTAVYLTAKEFDLFYFLFSHKGQVFTKEQLYENIWGYDYTPDASNLTSFIRKLRKKIEPDPDNPQYIVTFILGLLSHNQAGLFAYIFVPYPPFFHLL